MRRNRTQPLNPDAAPVRPSMVDVLRYPPRNRCSRNDIFVKTPYTRAHARSCIVIAIIIIITSYFSWGIKNSSGWFVKIATWTVSPCLRGLLESCLWIQPRCNVGHKQTDAGKERSLVCWAGGNQWRTYDELIHLKIPERKDQENPMTTGCNRRGAGSIWYFCILRLTASTEADQPKIFWLAETLLVWPIYTYRSKFSTSVPYMYISL